MFRVINTLERKPSAYKNINTSSIQIFKDLKKDDQNQNKKDVKKKSN